MARHRAALPVTNPGFGEEDASGYEQRRLNAAWL